MQNCFLSKIKKNLDFIKNKKRWDDFKESNSQKIESAFKNFLNFEEDRPQSEKISVQDYQMFLRELFYDESGYVLVETENDTEDFFQKMNSYKKILKLIESYFNQNPAFGSKKINLIFAFSSKIYY